jgi:parallel beta-helix repeat protein
VHGNVVVESARDGIILESSSADCRVKGNTIRKCGRAGVLIRGTYDNNVTANEIALCWTGIKAGVAANHNRLIKNRALNNTLFDLNCGSNVWKDNARKGN